MKIINQDNNSIVAENAAVADTLLKRMRGLLGTSQLQPGQGMLIKNCMSVHTFFMKFPIDVVFIGKDNRVVKAIPDLRPWRLTGIYPKANLCLELPAGTISQAKIAKDTLIKFV